MAFTLPIWDIKDLASTKITNKSKILALLSSSLWNSLSFWSMSVYISRVYNFQECIAVLHISNFKETKVYTFLKIFKNTFLRSTYPHLYIPNSLSKLYNFPWKKSTTNCFYFILNKHLSTHFLLVISITRKYIKVICREHAFPRSSWSSNDN